MDEEAEAITQSIFEDETSTRGRTEKHDRRTDRRTDRQANKQTDKQPNKQTDTPTDRQAEAALAHAYVCYNPIDPSIYPVMNNGVFEELPANLTD